MKFNYVSVLREHRSKGRDGCYYVRGELESQPTTLWFKQFQLIWGSTPAYKKLCSEPQLSHNDILIPLSDGTSIIATIAALRNVIEHVREPILSHEDPLYIENIREAVI